MEDIPQIRALDFPDIIIPPEFLSSYSSGSDSIPPSPRTPETPGTPATPLSKLATSVSSFEFEDVQPVPTSSHSTPKRVYSKKYQNKFGSEIKRNLFLKPSKPKRLPLSKGNPGLFSDQNFSKHPVPQTVKLVEGGETHFKVHVCSSWNRGHEYGCPVPGLQPLDLFSSWVLRKARPA